MCGVVPDCPECGRDSSVYEFGDEYYCDDCAYQFGEDEVEDD